MNRMEFKIMRTIIAGGAAKSGDRSRSPGLHWPRGLAGVLHTALVMCVAVVSHASPIISEAYYDAPGSDNGYGFVEIYGEPGTDLAGLTLEGVNGANGASGPVIPLAGMIPADGIFVVADVDTEGGTFVANADLLANFDFQNGPDSIVLLDLDGVLDALGYGVFSAGEFFAGEGESAPDPDVGSSLARRYANVDTDDNFSDFIVLDPPTPGYAPVLAVPEPSAATMLFTGLSLVGCLRRWNTSMLA